MESIIEFLKRHLRDAGAARWEAIAVASGVAKTLPRKIAYDDRDNPGVQTVQPLVDFFQQVERGERVLPEVTKPDPTAEAIGSKGAPKALQAAKAA